MKVVRRALVLDAKPPTKDYPFYTIFYNGRAWNVEQDEMLELYELEAVAKVNE